MRRASWVARARWTLITLFVVGITWHVAGGLGGDPGILVPIAVYTVVGALVTSRRPANPIGWVFLGVAGVTGIGSIAESISSLAIGWESMPWWAVLAAGVGAMWFYPLPGADDDVHCLALSVWSAVIALAAGAVAIHRLDCGLDGDGWPAANALLGNECWRLLGREDH